MTYILLYAFYTDDSPLIIFYAALFSVFCYMF